MNACEISLGGAQLACLPSGALWWPAEALLCVSDLHLGKSGRIVRRGGAMLPPYETRDTLARLDADIGLTGAKTVICLGDSFDDPAAAATLGENDQIWIARLQAGRRWIWIEGNHDPGPIELGGTHRAELTMGGLIFRHIAQTGAQPEISGHYHPKARLTLRGRSISRPCFLHDDRRLILPAYGTYTGGLSWTSAALRALIGRGGRAVLVGPRPYAVPVPMA